MEFFLVLLFASLNQPKSSIILLDNNKTSSIIISNESGDVVLDKPNTSIEVEDNKSIGKIKAISQEDIDKKFGNLLELKNLKPKSYFLYFEVNSDELIAQSVADIPTVLKSIKDRAPCEILVIGHTDTMGEDEDNFKISKDRAEVTKQILISKGVAKEDIQTDGYGEKDLLIQTANDVDEPKNRTVEIFIK